MTGNKYTELEMLHEQLRATNKSFASNGEHSVTNKRSDHFSSKSSAQVESLVRPQVVSPNSGELKLGRERPYRLMGRFSATERETVFRNAKEAEMSVNEYIRTVSLGNGYKPPLSVETRTVLFGVYRELISEGNNLNQIAKKMNGGAATPSQGVAMLQAIREPLIGALRAVIKTLDRGGPMP